MTVEPAANAAEHRRWNDTRWTSAWLRREQLTETVTGFVLAHLALRPGERVLEIGSGGGGLSTAAAARVAPDGGRRCGHLGAPGPGGRGRAATARLTNVSFVLADAQTDSIAGAPFEAATSQFGVMFFDEPVTAFANVARHLEVGGRLVFACWQRVQDNPWHIGPTLAPYLAPAPEPAPGKSATGPFSFGDPDRVRDLLTSAG